MVEKFLAHIKRHELCDPEEGILLAVSGGIDSMVMLQLFLEAGIRVGVAHANFGLRGVESDEDERFVANRCHRLNVPFFSKQFETNNYATESGLSIQMAARQLRYRWFEELMQEQGYARVATAHHLQDSLETVLLNFSRGSGVDGMLGIPVVNGKIIRPLLFASREEVNQYAADTQLAWREDESNSLDDYQRNLIRHKVISHLKILNPSLEEAFSDYVSKLSATREMAEVGMANWKEKFWRHEQDLIFIKKEGLEDRNALGILWQLLKPYGFHIDQIKELIAGSKSQSGKSFFSEDYELVLDRDSIILALRIIDTDRPIEIGPGQTSITRGREHLTIYSSEVISRGSMKSIGHFDADKLKFPLLWRNWSEGDFFYPLGMSHRKKLSDFFIDEKIPLVLKKRITVLESQGEIAWVVGYRIDDRFKITESTAAMLRLEFTAG